MPAHAFPMVRRTLGIRPAPRNVTGGRVGVYWLVGSRGDNRRMDTMEFNKLVAAVLVAGITFFLCGVIAENLVRPERLEKTAIAIDVGGAGAAAPAASKEEGPAPIGPLLAGADAGKGEGDAKKLCSACHTFNEGGKNGVGPNLYGVLGRERASEAGFAYSGALKGKTGKWTYEDLNHWLLKPAGFVPGTKMGFAGIHGEKERADVIAYLRSLSKSPEPLP
jgi:cytochrome c